MSVEATPSLLATLIERLRSDEGLEIEFKSARGGLPQSLWPTVSAFANTSGGWIVLGVGHDEKTGATDVQGVSQPHALLQDFYNVIRNPQKISSPVCGANDVSIEPLGERQVIIMRVPAAPRKARPIYINGNAYGGTYLRRNSGDYRCTKPEVDRMMREASDVAADSIILKHYGLDDLERDALARYRRRYQTFNPLSPWNEYDDQGFLQAIGGFRHDRETGERGITVAGLLMLGKPEAIREWRTRHLIDYRRVSGEPDFDVRWEDRLVWEGNLFDGFLAIYARLIEGLPVPFKLRDGIRIDESPVQVALREALVNLLVHADYAETDASLIIKSPNEFRFRNPGSSRVSEIDLLTGDRSDPRNPELLRMFRYIGFADEAGTGMPKIREAWRVLGYQLPAFDAGTERYEFALHLRLAHLLSEDDRVWLGALGEPFTESEQLALVLSRHEGSVDNLKLRSLTREHSADVTKILGGLRDREFLTMSGTGRTASYQLGTRATDKLVELGLRDLVSAEASSGNKGESSGNKEASSGNKGESSGGKEISTDPPWAELETIAESSRMQPRLSPEIQKAIVTELCSKAPLSLSELARLMGRTVDSVRNVIQHLIASNHLGYLYPAQPTHPKQKYVTKRSYQKGESE